MTTFIAELKVPPLRAEETYIQPDRDRFNDRLPVDKVRALAWADQAATLYIEESEDGAVWTAKMIQPIAAKTTMDTGWVALAKRRYRFKVVNGAAAQGEFILYQQIIGLGEGQTDINVSIERVFTITPNDAENLPHNTIAIYIGGAGDLKIDTVNGDNVLIKNLSSGIWHPIKAKKVYAAGTTATNILGAY